MNKQEYSTASKIYSDMVRRKILFIFVACIVMILAFIANMLIGLNAGADAGLKALFYPESARSVYNIMIHYRIPESCFGMLVGIALGMAGAEMQTILNNPLAEPYTLGISAAASLGASLVIAFGFGVGVLGSYTTAIMAFVCSMIACFAIVVVSNRRTSTPTTTILIGVAMLFLFQALVSLIQSISSKDVANSIMFWMFGSIGRNSNYSDILFMTVVIILVALLFSVNVWKLNSLKMGDNKAASMGINVRKLRRNMILGISTVTAVAVSFTGTIGFVGLIGPHVARMLVGDDQRFFLPMSALSGGCMLLSASVICKLTPFASTLPIGVVTSLVGVPFFLFLIFRRKSVII